MTLYISKESLDKALSALSDAGVSVIPTGSGSPSWGIVHRVPDEQEDRVRAVLAGIGLAENPVGIWCRSCEDSDQ